MCRLYLTFAFGEIYVLFSSPVKDTVVVNDRWGVGDRCQNGGVFTCTDRYNPGKDILYLKYSHVKHF